MKKIKHSKFKNTGMLFELLVRQITSDIISANESVATIVLKKFFNKNTELNKEYALYKTLSEERFSSDSKAGMLVDAVIRAKKSINKKKLSEEKYELIKTIKENFELDSFFQTKVQNYKLLASIYKILEYTELDNPTEITRSKITIIENMTAETRSRLNESSIDLSEEPKEIRLMSYKILVEKFNTKYENLSSNQKNLLREYIQNVSTTNNLKTFIQKESQDIKKLLESKMKNVKDKAVKIKLNEVVSLLDQYKNMKNVEENHVSALLRYYDLINDLDGVK
jgi:hypothetical protein